MFVLFVLHGFKLVVDTYQLFLLFKFTSLGQWLSYLYFRAWIISFYILFIYYLFSFLSVFLFSFHFVTCHWKPDSHSKACCRGRTSWSQTTQGNGILINKSCDIAPLFIHTHRKIKEFLKLSILLQHFSQYAQVCKSLGRTGCYESM